MDVTCGVYSRAATIRSAAFIRGNTVYYFLQQHPYFLLIFKCFSFLLQYFFVIKFYVLNNFLRSINTHTGDYRASHGSHMKAARFIQEEAHTNKLFISCDGHQLYAFKGLGVDLEEEGVHYIEMHRGPAAHVLDPPPSIQGAEIGVVHGTLTWSGV